MRHAIKYISTRDNYPPVEASQAICLGMVPGGGLFVPERFPRYYPEGLEGLSYQELAQDIFTLYLGDYSSAEIAHMAEKAYGSGHFPPSVAPLVQAGDWHILELWHGPTAAFKDMALQILPYELALAVEKSGAQKETVILVATSGDTGKAALEGFKDVPGMRIIVFYPAWGVSAVQERQMLITEGDNTHVVAVEGNFDHCQTAVKSIFGDAELVAQMAAAGKSFSSANSINWGRLLPQIVYYYYGYGQMVSQGSIKAGEPVNISVPTGNFGNILAAYYAKRMGLPVAKLICASNRNNVLTDAIQTGLYDCRREFYKTTSPSMDILISSNFERFFFEMAGRKGDVCSRAFQDLSEKGSFEAGAALQEWAGFLEAGFADDRRCGQAIADLWQKAGYLLDPHTAVAVAVAEEYRAKTGDSRPMLLASTANPYKFPGAVLEALEGQAPAEDEQAMLKQLHAFTQMPVHRALEGLEKKPIRHHRRIKREEIAAAVREICGLA